MDLRQVELQLCDGKIGCAATDGRPAFRGPKEEHLFDDRPGRLEILPRDLDVLGHGGILLRRRGRGGIGRGRQLLPEIQRRCRCRCRCRRRGLLCHIGHHRPGVVPVVLGLFETVQKRRSVQIVEGREGLVELDPSLVVVAVAVAAGGTRCGRALPDGRGGGDQFFLDDGEGLFEVVGVEQLFREDVALGVFRGPVGGSHGGGCRSRSGRWRRRHRRGRRGRVLGAVFVAR
mmetsp:Transcript_35181/g.73897  ORF Transcript_35181/g.73897 Transcript_35181/m.73897 type:complete len:231 (+) Transcript_35181:1060-1752(+)